jgi:drug/metabolite transporter (DMT)-like permease
VKSKLVLPHSNASAISIAVSLGIIYFVWASTYVGIAFMVEEIPPHTGSGFRFVTAGLLISTLILLTKGPKHLFVDKKQVRNAMLIGFILIGLATPLIAVASQYIGSGLIALLVAMTPVCVAILRFIFGDKPNWKTVLGISIGIIGVAILVRPTPGQGWYTLIPIASTVLWAIGSFWAQKIELPKSALTTAAWQTLFGGTCAIGVGFLRGEETLLFFQARELETWVAFFYISIMGAIAYSAYAFLLDNAPISLVATYAFVNPVVAVFLGAVLRNELITFTIFVGGFIVVLGIALTVLGETKKEIVNP